MLRDIPWQDIPAVSICRFGDVPLSLSANLSGLCLKWFIIWKWPQEQDTKSDSYFFYSYFAQYTLIFGYNCHLLWSCLVSSKACGRVPVFYVPLINSLSLASQTGQSPNLFKISVFLMTEMEGDDINLPSHQFIFNQQAFVHFDASISSLIFLPFYETNSNYLWLWWKIFS